MSVGSGSEDERPPRCLVEPAIRCVFCSGTGVHECPGGELDKKYLRKRDELRAAHLLDGQTFEARAAVHEWVGPGWLDAACYPAIEGQKPGPSMLEKLREVMESES